MSVLGGILTLIVLNAGIIIGMLLPDIVRSLRDRLSRPTGEDAKP